MNTLLGAPPPPEKYRRARAYGYALNRRHFPAVYIMKYIIGIGMMGDFKISKCARDADSLRCLLGID